MQGQKLTPLAVVLWAHPPLFLPLPLLPLDPVKVLVSPFLLLPLHQAVQDLLVKALAGVYLVSRIQGIYLDVDWVEE